MNYDVNTEQFTMHVSGNLHGNVNIFYGTKPSEGEFEEFRKILLGDINLLHEIRLNGQSGVVGRKKRGSGVRRMYSAKVEGRAESGPMTVAMYQGNGAEEQWRQHVAKYESVRHLNVVQLYGIVSTTRLQAAVFHDYLIPFNQYFRWFQYSPVLRAYISGCCTTEFWEVIAYFDSVYPRQRPPYDGALWIRPATGQLCMELVGNSEMEAELKPLTWDFIDLPRFDHFHLDDHNAEAVIVSTR